MTVLLLLSTAVITHRPPHATGPAAGSAPRPCTKIDYKCVTPKKIYAPCAQQIYANSYTVSLGLACRASPLHAMLYLRFPGLALRAPTWNVPLLLAELFFFVFVALLRVSLFSFNSNITVMMKNVLQLFPSKFVLCQLVLTFFFKISVYPILNFGSQELRQFWRL